LVGISDVEAVWL